MLGNFIEACDKIYGRVFSSHRNYLVVYQAGIDHLHITDHECFYQAKGLNGLRTDHEDIQRVPVFAKRLWNKSIINGIMEGRINYPVQLQQTGCFIDLVFCFRILRDLYPCIHDLRRFFAVMSAMPGMQYVHTIYFVRV